VEAVIMADIADDRTHYSLTAHVDTGGIDSLIEMLREFKNPITNQIADMLDPHGDTVWKLVLKRRRRGKPSEPPFIWEEYQEALQKRENKRGAIKSVEHDIADRFNITTAAVRSAVRRMNGTHGRRRKRKSGHK
jgi:hypothetical protein